MGHIIEILLVAGILANVLKGAELILRPHQQKWVQTKVEYMTLWLEYSKPLEWFRRITRKQIQIIAIVIILVIFLFILSDLLMRWGIFFSRDDKLTMAIMLFFVLINGLIPVIALTVYGSKFLYWLYSEGKFLVFLRKYFSFAVLSSMALFLLFHVIKWIASYLNPTEKITGINFHLLMACIVAGIFLCIFYIAFVISVLCLFIIITQIILFVAEVILIALRAIAWRVSEYNKGAFAAVILVFTILLGAGEAYLKFLKP
jgi:hypothetical protein